jgi:hypothetical protein
VVIIGVVVAPSTQTTARTWHDEVPPPHVTQPANATH